MENKEDLFQMVEKVLNETTIIAQNYDRVSRAYVNCIAEIKEARIDFTKQISLLVDRVSILEKQLEQLEGK